MNRTLVIIGGALLALGIIAGAATIAFSDGWDDEHQVEYRVVSESGGADSGGNVIVVTDDGWRRGPGFFPFFPLLLIGGIVLTVGLLSRGRGRPWHNRRELFEDWHRQAHSSPTSTEPNR